MQLRVIATIARVAAVLAMSWCARVNADSFEQDPTVAHLSDLGGVGLLQTPNARFGADGEFSFTIGRVEPIRRYTVTVQALPFLEATLRYSDIRNKLYSNNQDFSGDQTYVDRGVDLKLRILEERKYIPQLAVGLRDIGGTGLFSSEYLVGSKRFGAFDLTLGAAWGTLGSNGTIKNPFTYLSERFSARDIGGPGTLSQSLFSGETIGLFGGISYAAPIKGLRLNIEYDSTNYSLDNTVSLSANSQINYSADYEVTPLLNASIGFERGNTLMWRATLHTNFNVPSLLPDFAPPPIAVLPDPPTEELLTLQSASIASSDQTGIQGWEDAVFALAEQARLDILSIDLDGNALRLSVEKQGFGMAEADDYRTMAQAVAAAVAGRSAGISSVEVTGLDLGSSWVRIEVPVGASSAPNFGVLDSSAGSATEQNLRARLTDTLAQQRITLIGVRIQKPKVELVVARQHYRAPDRALGRTLRAVASVMPPEYQDIRVIFSENGLSTQEVSVVRSDFVATALGEQTKDELARHASVSDSSLSLASAGLVPAGQYPQYSFSVNPKTRQSIGRPEQFITYQLYAEASAQVAFSPSFTVTATLGQDIINNFDALHVSSDSVVPHVRSDIAKYLDEGASGISNIRADYLFSIAPRLFGRVSGGLLEDMFAGVQGEVLYAPAAADWAVGVDIAHVQQRGYDRLFSLLDYKTTTGHATFYYKPPSWNGITIRVPVGRYLAGDVGATLDISRKFDSGITVGAFATKTDLSAEEFGEGEFDKGIYLSMPLDQILPTTQRSTYSLLYRPLTRDGGQRLSSTKQLYDSVRADDVKALDSLTNILR
jgi:hypothetical protein